jgi:Tfp pilus assembly protein PilF
MRTDRARRGWGTIASAGVLALLACAGLGLSLGGCSNSKKNPSARADTPEERYLRARELNQRALEAQRAGRDDEAISLYRDAVQAEPKMFQAWNNLGVLYMQKQNYVEAGLALKSAADLAPSDPVPVENLALAYYRAGYAAKALDYYIEAITRAPHRTEGYRGAFKASEQLGLKDAAALDRVNQALMIETDSRWREIYTRKQVWLNNEPGAKSAVR